MRPLSVRRLVEKEGIVYPDYFSQEEQMIDTYRNPGRTMKASGWSLLLDLPREIRNIIHEYLLVAPGPLPTFVPPVLGVNVLRTCRQVYRETLVVLYKRNQWRFEFQSKEKKYYEYFLSCLSVSNAKRMRDLEIVLWGDYFGEVPLHWERRGQTNLPVRAGIDLKHLIHAPKLVVCIDFYEDVTDIEGDVHDWLDELLHLSFTNQPFGEKLVFDTSKRIARDCLDVFYGRNAYRSCVDSRWFRERRCAQVLSSGEDDTEADVHDNMSQRGIVEGS